MVADGDLETLAEGDTEAEGLTDVDGLREREALALGETEALGETLADGDNDGLALEEGEAVADGLADGEGEATAVAPTKSQVAELSSPVLTNTFLPTVLFSLRKKAPFLNPDSPVGRVLPSASRILSPSYSVTRLYWYGSRAAKNATS